MGIYYEEDETEADEEYEAWFEQTLEYIVGCMHKDRKTISNIGTKPVDYSGLRKHMRKVDSTK